MNVQLETTVDLDEKAIYNFVLDSTQAELKGPDPLENGFVLTSTRVAGTSPQKLFSQVKEYYNVLYKNSVVNSFTVIIPVEQLVDIEVTINLLTQNGLEVAVIATIKTAFDSYDPLTGIEPMTYIYQQLQGQPLGAPDSFIVKASYVIKKNGAPIEYRDQINQVLSLYNSSETVSRLDVFNDQSTGAYLSRRGYKPVLIKRENLEGFQNPPHDSIREIESTQPNDLDSIMQQETNGLDCGSFKTEKIRIQTVFAWPEFKADVGWHWIKVGCIPLYVPFIKKSYKRFVIKVLYAFVGHPNNFQQYVISQIKDCATGSALASAVLGIALLDLPAALLAFKPLFTQCIISTIGSDIQCLIPDLAIESESGAWQEI